MIALRQVAPEDQGVPVCLKNLIGILKGMKESTGASQETDQPEIEKFVGTEFKKADDELRGGNADPATIKKLLDAANLIELLIVFGPIGSESVKRSKKNSIYRAEVLEEFRFLGAPSQFLVQKLDFEWFTFVPLPLNGISEVNLLYQLFKKVSVKVRSKSFC